MELSMETNETLTVAAAIIESNGRYLLCKRSKVKENPGMWEFPGGKLKEGESLKQCVEREYQEEFGQSAQAEEILASTEVMANGRRLRLFGLKTEIQKEPGQSHDHDEIRWCDPQEFANLPMTPAELGLIQNLRTPKKSESEVMSVNVWSCAKLGGCVYGIVGIFAALFLYFFSAIITSSMPLPMSFVSWPFKFLAFSIPLFNFFLGAFLGSFFAIVYNVLAVFVGGIKLRLN
jgi:mutator protein MutT